jgi:predicted enzyme related to lactoylglutathione lyase
LVVDCAKPRELAGFWAAVLGGEVQVRDPDWCHITPPGWTQLSFQRVPESKRVKNRLHIDVAVSDLGQAANDAEDLGAQRVGTTRQGAGGVFQVLHDPEGNEWCLVQLN